MNRQQFERYSRQIRLSQIGESGQQRLLDARILIVGMGGLGSPAALYLAAAGVGHLIVSDFDRVEESNLQRQIVHRADRIGESKVASAREALLALNPDMTVSALDYQLEGRDLIETVRTVDAVLDCTDNFPTRFAINAACVRTRTPLITAGAIRFEAQMTTIMPDWSESPCYRCLYEEGEDIAESCAAEGVIAPLVGIVGSLQAMEAVKVLTGCGETLCGRLLLLDALAMDWREVRLRRNPRCPVCAR